MKNNKIPQRGEIWLVDYNYKPKQGKIKKLEIESLIKKLRPSLIISNDTQNEYDEEIIAAPLTSKNLIEIRSFEVLVKKDKKNNLEQDSKILLNRIRVIAKETRLKSYCGVVNEEIMEKVKKSLELVLDLED